MMLEVILVHLELSLEILFVNRVSGGAERKATTALLKVGVRRKTKAAERTSGDKGWKGLWQAQASDRTLSDTQALPLPSRLRKGQG